jgi:hypothetical protein
MSQKAYPYILLLLFTALSIPLYAQSEDQVKKDTNKYFDVIKYTADNKLLNDTNGVFEDTLYLSIFRYDPQFTGNYLYASMGNIGRPHRPLFLSTPSINFTYRVFPMEAYEYKLSSLNIYDVKGPYTRLFYVMGSGKENYLSGVHAQQINNIAFGVDFRIISSLGSYRHEKSSNTGGSAYLSYQHPKKQYGAFTALTFNRIKPQENGGILYDTIFEQNTEPTRAGVSTRLSNAQNKLKTNTLYFSQYFNPLYNPKDSNKLNLGTFEHVFSYERTDHVFSEEEPNPANYTFFLRDTLNTYDSTSFKKATNGIYWLNHSIHRPCKRDSYLFIKLGIIHEYGEIDDYIQTHYISQFIPEAHVSYKYRKDNELGIKGAYILNGYSKDGFQSTVWMKAKPWKNSNHLFKISGTFSSKMPDFFYSHYHGNNYQWDNNNLVRILQSQTDIEYSNKHIELGISNFTISNQVFIDNRYQPLQFDKALYYLQGYANIKFNYRSFYWLANITSTQGNNDTLMAFPKFTTRQSIFFRFPVFDKRMQFQTGVDLMYISEYYAPNYVPAIGEFVIQNSKTYGNFLYASYFIGFKVKQFNAMLKVQNVAKGLLGYNYMMMPQYPMPDRLFKLAVSWRFYD